MTNDQSIVCEFEAGPMVAERYLIVNADDFGLSPGVNRGIIKAHEQGIVTSASFMVRWPAAATAAAYGREHPGFSIGLHVDLGEWVYQNEKWECLYEVICVADRAGVADETDRQLAAFRRLLGRNPSHIDSHQHVHRREPIRSVALETALELRAPVRECTPGIGYCGRFYGQTAEGSPYAEGITSDALIDILSQLPPGITELACHPGEGEVPNTTYIGERAIELKTLCDARVRSALIEMGIELCGFTALPSLVSAEIGSAT